MKNKERFLFRLLVFVSLIWRPISGSTQADSGKWTSIGPNIGAIQAVAVDPRHPQTIYAGTRGAGIFKTTDGGATWSAANKGLIVTTPTGVQASSFLWTSALAVNPTDTNTVFAGTESGVVKTTDGGAQ